MIFVGIYQLICAALIPFVTWFLWWKWSDSVKKMENIPGPSPLPFLGNALQIMKPTHEVLQLWHIKWVKEFGEIYRIWIGFRKMIMLCSPEHVEVILNNQKLLDKTESYDLMRPWIGDGLLNSTGPKWRSRRKLLTPAFHFGILDTFFKVFQEQSNILVEILQREMDTTQGAIDIYPYVTRCTLDIICEATMGTQVKAQQQDSEYVKAIYRLSQVTIERLLRPWLYSEWIFRCTALGRENAKNLKIVHEFTDKVIDERNRQLHESSQPQENAEKKIRYAFLDTLLNAAKENPTLTRKDIREEVDTFMFEGHDTTSAAICWFLYCMALHPEEQVKVQEEIDTVFESTDGCCTLNNIGLMKYLECCVKEALRLYPSAPFIERKINQDIVIGGHTIPAHSSMVILIYGLHRNERVFPDPNAFKPSRFFDDEPRKRHPFAFIPFSAGPRNCIGQRFALLEEKVVLSTLLHHFSFSVDPKMEPFNPCTEVILKSKQGFPLFMSCRR